MQHKSTLSFLAVGLMAASLHAAVWNVTLIEQADNPQLDRTRLERAYLGHAGGSAADGLNVAFDEAQFELEAEKASVKLKVESAVNLEAAKVAAQKAEKAGAALLVLSLPGAWVGPVAASVKVPLLNVRARDDVLREKDCGFTTCCPASACVLTRWPKPWWRGAGKTCWCSAVRCPKTLRAASLCRPHSNVMGSKQPL